MKRLPSLKWWHVALFGAIFALSATAMVPARWLGTALDRSTDGRVRLLAASGSPWIGRGHFAIRVGEGTIMLQNTTWRWQPARLITGDLAFELRFAGDAKGTAVIAGRPSALVVRAADVTMSAATIAESFSSQLRDFHPAGMITLRTQGFTMRREGFAGDAEVTWQGAATPVAPLGDYQFLIHASEGSPAQLQVATLRGPLHLAASGDYGPAEGLRIRGTATPAAEYRAQLMPFLALIGVDRGDGAVVIDIALPGGGRV